MRNVNEPYSIEYEKGVLFIAFGELYIKEALIASESVKNFNSDIHITLMSNLPTDSDYINNNIIIEATHIRAKVDYIHKTPYKKTIFLDSDTIINHDISEMFEILDKYDFAICHDLARKRDNISKIIPEYKIIPYAFSEVNPGVFVFNNNTNVQDFFAIWKDLFYKYKPVCPYEQPTFRVALWKSNMLFYILPIEYNVRGQNIRKKAVIMHDVFGVDHLKTRIYHMHVNKKISKGIFKIFTVSKSLKYCKKNAQKY